MNTLHLTRTRKVIGRLIGLIVIIGAMVATLDGCLRYGQTTPHRRRECESELHRDRAGSWRTLDQAACQR